MNKLLLLSLGLLAACGTSTVSLVVVRPAVLNAAPYGNTVTVAGFRSLRPDVVMAAEALRQDVAARVRAGVGGVVRLADAGGGLMASGDLLEYGTIWTERSRDGTCSDTVRVIEHGQAKMVSQSVPCKHFWWDWRSTVRANLRVTSSQGALLYYRSHYAERTGSTSETRGLLPPQQDQSLVLAELRSKVADEMGAVLVPHAVRVNAQFFDCAQPAEQTCIAGMKAMVNNNFAGAAQAFTDAHAQLVQAKAVPNELAKPLWNRGLVYKYSREFDKAAEDIRQSCGIESRMACDGELRDIENERASHLKLVDEGLGR